MPSSRRHLARCLCLLLGITAAACSESNFPVTPTPTAQTPLVTLQTASYQGTILDAGQVTFFNMTLIARSLGATFALSAQAPGTTIVSGLFETGTGIEGTVEGTVSGTLQNGTVQLTLAVVHDGCTEQRTYTGIVTGSGVALTPGERTHSCPSNALTFAVQASIPTSPTCSYSVSPASLTISGNGGQRSVEVTTSPGCPWVAETGVPWLALTSQPTGSGSGSVVLVAQVNDGAARSGTARVAGQPITVAQGPQCSVALAPTSARVPAAGGTTTIAITAAAGCSWSADSSEPWLTVAPLSGEGSASVQVAVAANSGAERQGTVVIGGQSFTVTQDAVTPQCSITIAPTSARMPAAGGTTTIAITAAAGCSWSADSSEPWLTVAPRTGNGSGSVQVAVAANSGAQRQGTVGIGGQSFTVIQDAVTPLCSITIAPTSARIPAAGGTTTIAITAAAGCSWSADSSEPWLTVGPRTGTGSASVQVVVAANSGAQRQGTVVIGGQSFTVTQDAVTPPCSITIAPTSARIPAAGGNATIAVTAAAGCSWSADSSEPWLTVAPRTGNGSGSVQVAVAANSGAQRQGTVVIGGQSFTVTQDAVAACVFAISPTAGSIGTFGGSGTVAVTAQADCSWSVAVGTATWLQISPVSGRGSGTVTYSAGPNLGPARSATITIAGQPFSVVQAGNLVTISVSINNTTPPGFALTAGTVETFTSGKPDGRIRCQRFIDRPQTGVCTATFAITAPMQVTFRATPDPDFPGTQIRWESCGAGPSECSLIVNNGGTYKPMEVQFVRVILQ